MPRSNITDLGGLTDPLLQFNFDLVVPNMPGTTGYDARAFKTRIMTTSIPGRAIEPVTVGLHGSEIDFAGRTVYTRTLPFELVETRDMLGRKALSQWHRFTRDDSSLGAYANEYKTTVDLRLFDDKDNIVQIIRLFKCWLETYEDSSLDGSSSAAVTVTGTLRYFRYIEVSA